MSATVEELEAEVLRLPAVLRARLVEKLIASLDVEPDVENAWAEEVEKREGEIENGTVTLLPGAEALSRLRAEIQ
ncbi:addiction module protein [Accumulibacter sp.]|uniref:addiction module protein n=1 Tax=Accumulibacter sp. TaxID=2053492 RepID=UPI0025F726EA|nr:addiction module protein [Accumulibacter sp.]MCM8613514.1 addiction module protein [Accumulibacter sp.]MCM8637171.1 addiction module protein [Accumulibacter sp.]MCM8640765.1 addiction module protein [Accumulibacter sp.]